MADKELKSLSKGDLIEIIYQMKKTEIELRSELDAVNAKLQDRTLRLAEVGSIAEAVVSVNRLFEVAQKTADEYLEQVYAANANIEERCRTMEQESKAKCAALEQETDRIIAEKWDAFHSKAESFISAHAELSDLIKR